MDAQVSQKHEAAVAGIAAIDLQIDSVKRSAYMLAGFKAHPMSHRTWGKIWARFPSLYHYRDSLYIPRGELTDIRDAEEARAAKAAERQWAAEDHKRWLAARCPTCGHSHAGAAS